MTDRPPNIVLVLADDMGYGDPACYNPESRIPTPNMDRLAAEGMRFTDAHSSSSVCTPSRYGIMTGRYCWRTRLEYGVIGGYEPPLIEPHRPTVASLLKRCGYATACIGKWHIGSTFHDKDGEPTDREDRVDFFRPVSGGPTALGFDYAWYNAGCGTCAPPYGFIENDRFVDNAFHYYDNGQSAYSAGSGMMGDTWRTRDADVVIAAKAREYIEERSKKDSPFFLYVAPNAPHEPCVEELVPEFARGRSAAGARGDLVWLFDWIVGEVVGALERTGQAENTLLVVTSDNGALPGDAIIEDGGRRAAAPGRNFLFRDYGHRSCGDLRGHKAHIWEGGHREPLVVKWPGRVAPGATADATVCLGDLFATVAEIVGEELPENAGEDSFGFLHAMTGADPSGPTRDHVVHHSERGAFSVRQGHWKCIFGTKGSGGWPPPRDKRPVPGAAGQLYDLDVDPAETTDLWDEQPEIVERFAALLDRCRGKGRTRP